MQCENCKGDSDLGIILNDKPCHLCEDCFAVFQKEMEAEMVNRGINNQQAHWLSMKLMCQMHYEFHGVTPDEFEIIWSRDFGGN